MPQILQLPIFVTAQSGRDAWRGEGGGVVLLHCVRKVAEMQSNIVKETNLQQGLFDWKGNPLVVNLSGVAQGIMY